MKRLTALTAVAALGLAVLWLRWSIVDELAQAARVRAVIFPDSTDT